MVKKLNSIILLLCLMVPSVEIYARDINYNYLTDISEQVVEPFVWKNSVQSLSELSSIPSPVDGETRKVIVSGDIYQYSAKNLTWNKITKREAMDGFFFIQIDGDISIVEYPSISQYFVLDTQGDVTPKEAI